MLKIECPMFGLIPTILMELYRSDHDNSSRVAGAFMQVDIDEVMHIWLEGILAKLLTKVDPTVH